MPKGYPKAGRPPKVASLPSLCHPARKAFVGTQCRPCYEQWANENVPGRLERNRDAARERYRRQPAEQRRAGIVARYGITMEEVDTRLEQQGGKCALCPKDITGRAANGYSKACVDHVHGAKIVRGLLCTACNSSLGQLGDDVAGLERALAYVKAHA